MSKLELERVAANGLINRRHLLGLGLAGMGTVASTSLLGADAGLNLEIPGWSKQPGASASGYARVLGLLKTCREWRATPIHSILVAAHHARHCINCRAASHQIACILSAITLVFRR